MNRRRRRPFASAARFWHWPPAKQKQTGERSPPRSRPPDSAGGPWTTSVFGACGFALETSAGWVAYTGDLRFHGDQGPLSWKFAEDLAALCPFALLCEGTNLETAHQVTEAEVLENCLRAVQESAGKLVVADFAPATWSGWGPS